MAKRGIVDHGVQFVKHVVPAIVRPIHTLWHEIIGFFFSAFAVAGAMSGFRTARNFNGDPETLIKLIVTLCFVLLMAGFGISSFRRARKISRS